MVTKQPGIFGEDEGGSILRIWILQKILFSCQLDLFFFPIITSAPRALVAQENSNQCHLLLKVSASMSKGGATPTCSWGQSTKLVNRHEDHVKNHVDYRHLQLVLSCLSDKHCEHTKDIRRQEKVRMFWYYVVHNIPSVLSHHKQTSVHDLVIIETFTFCMLALIPQNYHGIGEIWYEIYSIS